MANEIRLQAMLGNLENTGRTDLNMSGYTCLARIIKIHHKRNTADVRLVRTNDVIMSIPQNEGKFSCRIGTTHAYFDPKTNKSSGVIEPLREGQLVIVGYLENLKNEPWILASLHWTMEAHQNILPSQYPISSGDMREYAKYLRVFPSQDYIRVDSGGNMEFALHGKSFLKIDDEITDIHNGTDFEDLLEKDKFTKKTRTMENLIYHIPKNILFVHRDNWYDEETKWTKFFLNSAGLFRISRDTHDDTLTFLELQDNGSWRLKRQLDSSEFDGGQNNVEIKVDTNTNTRITHKRILENNSSNVTTTDISETGAFSVSKDLMVSKGLPMESEQTNTSLSITDDNQANINRQHWNSLTRKGETTDIEINSFNEARLARNMTMPHGFRSSEITIDRENNIIATIKTNAGAMVDIRCAFDGTVQIYGKSGVTISSDGGSFSI